MTVRIELYRGKFSWLARSNDPQVLELFGTDTLPTAFTPEASATMVQRAIARLNPEAEVFVVEDERRHKRLGMRWIAQYNHGKTETWKTTYHKRALIEALEQALSHGYRSPLFQS